MSVTESRYLTLYGSDRVSKRPHAEEFVYGKYCKGTLCTENTEAVVPVVSAKMKRPA